MARQAWMATWGAALSAVALTVQAGCCSLDRPAPAPVVKVIPAPRYGTGTPGGGRERAKPASRPALPRGIESSRMRLEKDAPAALAVGEAPVPSASAGPRNPAASPAAPAESIARNKPAAPTDTGLADEAKCR
jgi:hypothetical protein